MITDTDIKKMKMVFATKDDLKSFEMKDELSSLNKKMDAGFIEIIEFIGEVKSDIMKELNEFRNEIRDINRNSQSTLNNYESRITQLEYINNH